MPLDMTRFSDPDAAQALIDSIEPAPAGDGEVSTFAEIAAAQAAADKRAQARVPKGDDPQRELSELLPVFTEFMIEHAAVSDLADAAGKSAKAENDPGPFNQSMLVRASVDGLDVEMLATYRRAVEAEITEAVGDAKAATAYFDEFLKEQFPNIVARVTVAIHGGKMFKEASKVASRGSGTSVAQATEGRSAVVDDSDWDGRLDDADYRQDGDYDST